MILRRFIAWIFKHPDIQKLMSRHQRLIQFFRSRLDRRTFFGWPLTLLTFSVAVCLWLLLNILQSYFAHDPLVAADVRITNLLFAFRGPAGVHLFYALTLLASPITAVVVIIFLGALLVFRRAWHTAFIGWISFSGAEATTLGLKLLLHRPRPTLLLQAVAEDSYSLPSGHATTAAFVFGFLGYLAILRSHSKFLRVLIVALVVLGVLAIDFSRLYLGVHYLSDVLAGNAVGFFALFIGIGMNEWWQEKKKKIVRPVPLSWLTIAPCLAILVSLWLFYMPPLPPIDSPLVHQRQMITQTGVLGLFENGSLPRYTEDIIGQRQEPISFVLIVPDSCLELDFAQAGWTLAAPISFSSIFKLVVAAVLNNSYPSAPVTPSFYNEQPQDFSFEQPTSISSVRQRHHARFWQTDYQTPAGRLIVGMASLDTGLKWGITHSIAPDIDTERDLLVSDLVGAGVVISQQTTNHFVDPVLGQNFTTDFFFTNGGAVFLKLSACQ